MESDDRLVWLRRLAVTVVVMTFALMVLGSWVKATGSGLACPDWPKCYGEWLPPFPSADDNSTYEGERVDFPHANIMYEWTHRLVASLLGIPMIAWVVLAWRGDGLHPAVRRLPAWAIAVLGIQILLGGLTVEKGNVDWSTTLHLATATLYLIIITIAATWTFLQPHVTRGENP